MLRQTVLHVSLTFLAGYAKKLVVRDVLYLDYFSELCLQQTTFKSEVKSPPGKISGMLLVLKVTDTLNLVFFHPIIKHTT